MEIWGVTTPHEYSREIIIDFHTFKELLNPKELR